MALKQISKLKAPKEGEARCLSKLFGSLQSVLTISLAFNPADELVVREAKRRKKSTSSSEKASKVGVCLLPHYMARVPKGKVRAQLKEKVRVKKITVKRSDTWRTVHNTLEATFGDLYSGMGTPTILCCDGTALSKDADQAPGGDAIIRRRGSGKDKRFRYRWKYVYRYP